MVNPKGTLKIVFTNSATHKRGKRELADAEAPVSWERIKAVLAEFGIEGAEQTPETTHARADENLSGAIVRPERVPITAAKFTDLSNQEQQALALFAAEWGGKWRVRLMVRQYFGDALPPLLQQVLAQRGLDWFFALPQKEIKGVNCPRTPDQRAASKRGQG